MDENQLPKQKSPLTAIIKPSYSVERLSTQCAEMDGLECFMMLRPRSLSQGCTEAKSPQVFTEQRQQSLGMGLIF